MQPDSDFGLYHYIDRDEESSGWNKMDHFLYKKEDGTKWCIDYSNGRYFFFIHSQEENITLKQVDLEEFLFFIKKETPEVLDWILFNVNILGDNNAKNLP